MGHLPVEQTQGVAPIGRGELARELVCVGQDGVRVACPGCRELPLVGALERVRRHGVEQLVASRPRRAADLDQARVDEPGHDLERVDRPVGEARDRLDQGGVRVGDHHRERQERLPLRRAQPLDAGVQRCPQAGSTARGPARPAAQVGLDQPDHLVDPQQLEVTRHQLDAERQAVHERAQPIGDGHLGRAEAEAWIEKPGAIDEQVDGVTRG